MQSTGQASTQAVSLVPMQGSAITYAMDIFSQLEIDHTIAPRVNTRRRRERGAESFSGMHPLAYARGSATVAFISQRLPSRGAVAQSNNVTVFSRRQWPLR